MSGSQYHKSAPVVSDVLNVGAPGSSVLHRRDSEERNSHLPRATQWLGVTSWGEVSLPGPLTSPSPCPHFLLERL